MLGARVIERLCAVEAVAGADEELRSLAESFAARRRFGMGDLAEQLESRGALRPAMSVDEAADVLWMMSSPANYRWFVLTRGWSPQHLAHWLGDALTSPLIDPQYRPPGTAEQIRLGGVEKH